jgi:hypothetical protein
MNVTTIGYALCGGMIAAVAIAFLPQVVSPTAGLTWTAALAFLTLVGGTLLLAVAAWSNAFRER